MRTEDLLEKQSERNQWLNIMSRRMDEFAKAMKNNLGIMELIVGSLNRSHKNPGAQQEKVNLTLDTIEQSKRLIEEKSSFPVIENMRCKPFDLKQNFKEVIENNKILANTKKIAFNVNNLNHCLLSGDEACFSLALGILFCYTINHLQSDQLVEVSFQQEDSRFLSMTLGPAKLDEDHSDDGFLLNILEEPNLCKAHLIFQKQGGGFAVSEKKENKIEIQILWPRHQ
ncbi:MAG: hypothetical protein ACD_73C00200G0006 [uncultured bacterium]|nr:MAG: hypothetical protein ACD_73C00200G0006 [uncultured bacterium]